MVLTLGLPCLLIYLSFGYAWRVFAFVFFALVLFFPSPPIRSGEAFSSVIFSSLSLLLFVFLDVAMVWKGKPASVTTGSRDRTYARKKKNPPPHINDLPSAVLCWLGPRACNPTINTCPINTCGTQVSLLRRNKNRGGA